MIKISETRENWEGKLSYLQLLYLSLFCADISFVALCFKIRTIRIKYRRSDKYYLQRKVRQIELKTSEKFRVGLVLLGHYFCICSQITVYILNCYFNVMYEGIECVRIWLNYIRIQHGTCTFNIFILYIGSSLCIVFSNWSVKPAFLLAFGSIQLYFILSLSYIICLKREIII